MPTLNWLGKAAVQNYSPPFHFLNKKFSVGNSDNMIIHADNLFALKSLLPRYENKIKCIYIDPPYNTGNENWIYNDNVSSPQLQKWLGQVVGKEGEDLTRHDKWLCMMYPRLKLLHRLLREDGAIFISIDDNELFSLKFVCDEIFGASNFCTCIIWNSTKSVTNTALISVSHTYNLLYFKNMDYWIKNRTKFRLPDDGQGFANPDNDPRGAWKADPFQVGGWRPNQQYDIINPKTGKIYKPNPGCSWKNDYEHFKLLLADNRIVFGKKGDSGPQRKRFLSEALERGKVAKTLWDDVGTTTNGTQTLKKILGENIFDNPKPVDLIERMLQLSTEKNSIVLDAFAGSGTTAHAVINLNNQDGGSRRFILIEMEDYAENITAERVKRVGGEFDFYELGERLFDDEGFINENAPLEKVFEYVYFSETGKNFVPTGEKNLLGVDDDTAYYFFSGESLSWSTLAQISTRAKSYVIYAESCNLSEDELSKYKITFKQLPFDVRRY